jgi:hypothetical protein
MVYLKGRVPCSEHGDGVVESSHLLLDHASVAQLGERYPVKVEVGGSKPLRGATHV